MSLATKEGLFANRVPSNPLVNHYFPYWYGHWGMHTQFSMNWKIISSWLLIYHYTIYHMMHLHYYNYYPMKIMTGFTRFYQIPSRYLPFCHSTRYDLVVLLLNRHNLGVVYPPMVPWFHRLICSKRLCWRRWPSPWRICSLARLAPHRRGADPFRGREFGYFTCKRDLCNRYD